MLRKIDLASAFGKILFFKSKVSFFFFMLYHIVHHCRCLLSTLKVGLETFGSLINKFLSVAFEVRVIFGKLMSNRGSGLNVLP
jgi:hypothetical protein